MYEKNKTGGKLKTVGQDHDTSKFGFLDEIGKKKKKLEVILNISS